MERFLQVLGGSCDSSCLSAGRRKRAIQVVLDGGGRKDCERGYRVKKKVVGTVV